MAKRQFGLVDEGQARVCGLSAKAVRSRTLRGLWTCPHRGVYLIGSDRPTGDARVLAAVLACGRDAVASHDAAAWRWGLRDRAPEVVDVTVPGRNAGSRDGVRVHRSTTLEAADLAWRAGTPVTAITRTLIDQASHLDGRELEAATALALRRRQTTPKALRAAVARAGRSKAKGVATLAAIAASDDPRLTRSRYERLMHSLVADAELPRAEANANVHGFEADLYWPDAGVVVEVDASGTHGDPRTFESDRIKDADLLAAGITVLRFTGPRIENRAHAVVARLAGTLALKTRHMIQGLPTTAPPPRTDSR